MRDSLLIQIVLAALTLIGSIIVSFAIFMHPRGRYVVGVRPDGAPQRIAASLRPAEQLRVLLGFLLSILASATWAAGNVLSRYSANAYSGNVGAIIDISLANYISGAVFVALVAAVWHAIDHRDSISLPKSILNNNKLPYIPALLKAVNTYLFVAAVMLVNAGIATTLENLHVLWTAIFVSLVGKEMLDRGWFISALLLTCGSVMILRFWDYELIDNFNVIGVCLSILAGIAFALFVISWNDKIEESDYAPQRAFGTAIFLLFTGVVLYLINVVIYIGASKGSLVPFKSLSTDHLLIQFGNGIINIGVTYFLLGESLKLMRPAKYFAALLLAMGISYAVLFTLLFELILFGTAIRPIQWVGIFLFSVGFSVIKGKLSSDAAKVD